MEWASEKGLDLLNTKGQETFFRKQYTSVLDLLWVSTTASARVTDFRVSYNLFAGGNHFPLTWTCYTEPLPPPSSSNFNFHDDNSKVWKEAFKAA